MTTGLTLGADASVSLFAARGGCDGERLRDPSRTHSACACVKGSVGQGEGNAMCILAFPSWFCFGGWVTAVRHQLR